jgi:hypothetical protein
MFMSRLFKIAFLLVVVFSVAAFYSTGCGGGDTATTDDVVDDGTDTPVDGDGNGDGDGGEDIFFVNKNFEAVALNSILLMFEAVGIEDYPSPSASISKDLLKSPAPGSASVEYTDIDFTKNGAEGGSAHVTGRKALMTTDHCAIFVTFTIDYDLFAEAAGEVIDGMEEGRIIVTSYECLWSNNLNVDLITTGNAETNGVVVSEIDIIAYFGETYGSDGFDFTVDSGIADTLEGRYYCAVNPAGGTTCTLEDQRDFGMDYCFYDSCEVGKAGDEYCKDVRPNTAILFDSPCAWGNCCEYFINKSMDSCLGNGVNRRECDQNMFTKLYTALHRIETEEGFESVPYEVLIKCAQMEGGMWMPPCTLGKDDLCPWGSRCVLPCAGGCPGWDGLDTQVYGYCNCFMNNTELLCDDGLDNDDDGAPDCHDQDCHRHWYGCVEENCTNNVDDDFDCLIDCMDDDCRDTTDCNVVEEDAGNGNCEDGLDNDFDGRIDCRDGGCQFHEGCEGGNPGNCSECGDGMDNDNDGYTDCYEFSCDINCNTECPLEFDDWDNPIMALCNDDVDNDGDGDIDCDDWDCLRYPMCWEGMSYELSCTNGIDDDRNHQIDCEDVSCVAEGGCPELCFDVSPWSIVSNTPHDNDLDGLKDGFDPDCWGHQYCTGETECNNSIDDDGDVEIDCADSDCVDAPNC